MEGGVTSVENGRVAVSTIIRIHDEGGTGKLRRAIQSLYSQTDVHVHPIVVSHAFGNKALAALDAMLAEERIFPWLEPAVLLDVKDQKGQDIRSRLINIGISRHFETGNRFLSFLDYDDLLYSHALSRLTKPLLETSAVFAFGGIELAQAMALNDYDFIYSMSRPYSGKGKIDLLRDNFCPLHSYVVDTSKLHRSEVLFDERLSRIEDYEFLLRVAGRHPCDFSNLSTYVGAYLHRSDGSNSTPRGCRSESDQAKELIWRENRALLRKLRSSLEVKFFASDF